MSSNDITTEEDKKDKFLVYLGMNNDEEIMVMTRKDFYENFPRDKIYEINDKRFKIALVIDPYLPKEYDCIYTPVSIMC